MENETFKELQESIKKDKLVLFLSNEKSQLNKDELIMIIEQMNYTIYQNKSINQKDHQKMLLNNINKNF